jgi:hypothetical protein
MHSGGFYANRFGFPSFLFAETQLVLFCQMENLSQLSVLQKILKRTTIIFLGFLTQYLGFRL